MNQDFLKQTLLFQDLTEEELVEIILIGQVIGFKKDQVIFREGEPGDTLYLIVEGSVRISKMSNNCEEALTILEARSFFGEMTLFDQEPRSAWAIAHEDSSVFAIRSSDLFSVFENNRSIGYKFLWAFCQTLAKRLRMTNEKFNIMMSLANVGF
ncbi:MAG: cyclic nucleotide-binding domain-containing protein [Acidobacteria bacterium]|nr:cyclic nucleotide-binding domain-containing protein [Acidobacteriota bacterium]